MYCSAFFFINMFMINYKGRSRWKNLEGAMAPRIRENKGVLGALLPANFLYHALFALRKHSVIVQTFATYTRKSCKNERVIMKESKQSDREIEYRMIT